jgi:hypothetical protein
MKSFFREQAAAFGIVSLWIVGLVVLVLMLSLLWLGLRPTLNNLWLSGHRTTNEYVSTGETMLFKYKNNYERLEVKIAELGADSPIVPALRGQQKSILEEMIVQASKMHDAGAPVPPSIQTFITEKKSEHNIP